MVPACTVSARLCSAAWFRTDGFHDADVVCTSGLVGLLESIESRDKRTVILV